MISFFSFIYSRSKSSFLRFGIWDEVGGRAMEKDISDLILKYLYTILYKYRWLYWLLKYENIPNRLINRLPQCPQRPIKYILGIERWNSNAHKIPAASLRYTLPVCSSGLRDRTLTPMSRLCYGTGDFKKGRSTGVSLT